MFRKSIRRLADKNVQAVAEASSSNTGILQWVDKHFLANQKPPVPSGAWPKDLLERKSLGDLQQIWFILLKERNMLLTMKHHYTLNQEELGAMPAPSRLKMVEQSMDNLKEVVRARDRKATEMAQEAFEARVKAGVYRYPPGPPQPPGEGDCTSTVEVKLSQFVSPDRLKELFGKFAVYEEHKGIVGEIQVVLPEEVIEKKRVAEEEWEAWQAAKLDYEDYQKTLGVVGKEGGALTSAYDAVQHVELAPGVHLNTKMTHSLSNNNNNSSSEGNNSGGEEDDTTVWSSTKDTEVVTAAALPVPPPQLKKPKSKDPLKRLQEGALPVTARRNIQLGYFPNVTMEAPPKPGPRPTHPDEILGPWIATIQYDSPDGYDYASSLGVKSIDGADVLALEEVGEPIPASDTDPVYQEAIRAEAAEEYHQKYWPMVPSYTKKEIDDMRVKPLDQIISHNYNNIVDYVEREALMTVQSVWDLPIDVDPSCGDSDGVPHTWEEENKDQGQVVDAKAHMWDEY